MNLPEWFGFQYKRYLSLHMIFWFLILSHCQATKALVSLLTCVNSQSLCCSHTQSMNVDEDSDQNLDLTSLDMSAWAFNEDV